MSVDNTKPIATPQCPGPVSLPVEAATTDSTFTGRIVKLFNPLKPFFIKHEKAIKTIAIIAAIILVGLILAAAIFIALPAKAIVISVSAPLLLLSMGALIFRHLFLKNISPTDQLPAAPLNNDTERKTKAVETQVALPVVPPAPATVVAAPTNAIPLTSETHAALPAVPPAPPTVVVTPPSGVAQSSGETPTTALPAAPPAIPIVVAAPSSVAPKGSDETSALLPPATPAVVVTPPSGVPEPILPNPDRIPTAKEAELTAVAPPVVVKERDVPQKGSITMKCNYGNRIQAVQLNYDENTTVASLATQMKNLVAKGGYKTSLHYEFELGANKEQDEEGTTQRTIVKSQVRIYNFLRKRSTEGLDFRIKGLRYENEKIFQALCTGIDLSNKP